MYKEKSGEIPDESILVNNELGENIKIYKDAEVKNSNIGDYVSIGNSSIVQNTNIQSNSAINRRNYILRSEIGSYTYTGIGTIILSAKIGNFCSIGWNVSIGGGNHDYLGLTTSPLWRFKVMDEGINDYKVNYEKQKPCIIGNDVWIASNVVILRDVKIGDGAVIGAGAVVTQDVEPYSIVAGIPAKKVKKRFDNNIIEVLKTIKWWEWPKDVIRDNIDLIYSSPLNEEILNKLNDINKKVNTDNKVGE